MIRLSLSLFALFVTSLCWGQADDDPFIEMRGKISSVNSKHTGVYSTVFLMREGKIIAATTTDSSGLYVLNTRRSEVCSQTQSSVKVISPGHDTFKMNVPCFELLLFLDVALTPKLEERESAHAKHMNFLQHYPGSKSYGQDKIRRSAAGVGR